MNSRGVYEVVCGSAFWVRITFSAALHVRVLRLPLSRRMEGADAASRKACIGVTETFHTLANEPSLGMYYVMEHIQRAVPALVADKQQHNEVAETFRGIGLDAGFALDDMKMATSGATTRTLDNILRLAEASQRQLASRASR